MPELPEVETVKSAIAPMTTGKRITQVFVGSKGLRWPFPQSIEISLKGERCGAPTRRGKYILIPVSKRQVLLIHLGMSGSIRIYPNRPILKKHYHFALGFEGDEWLVLCDPRRFGFVDLLCESQIKSHWLLKNLGPEPLSEDFTVDYLIAQTAGKTCTIKSLLLDQRKVAGIGNIYAAEALFMAGISPKRQAKTIKRARAERLVPAIQSILLKAIEAGGTSIRDHIQPGGEVGYFAQSLQIYGRSGEHCMKCGSIVKEIKQTGRTTFHCSLCQR